MVYRTLNQNELHSGQSIELAKLRRILEMTPMEINFKYEGDMRVSVYQTLSLMIAFGLLIVAVLKEQKK